MAASCGAHAYDRTCARCLTADAARSRRYYAERGGREMHRARYQKRMGIESASLTRPCRVCGVTFHKPTMNQKRCDECCASGFNAIGICERCDSVFLCRGGPSQRFCSVQCIAAKRRDPLDHRASRYQRELASPGLSPYQRAALRSRWLAQRRKCSYCPAVATTVDHVVPLNRGGTNYEGNLAPACRSCNSSKRDFLIVEWRRNGSPVAATA